MIDDKIRSVFEKLECNAVFISAILDQYLTSSRGYLSKEIVVNSQPFINKSEYLNSLKTLVKCQIFEEKEGLYKPLWSADEIRNLRWVLQGACWSSEIEPDKQIDIVMTFPRAPSKLKSELSKIGHRKSLIKGTTETFEDLAKNSQSTFSILTPFLDEIGAKTLVNLFRACPQDVNKELILRFLSFDRGSPRYPTGYVVVEDELKSLGVKVYDYALERDDEKLLETFHAKIVLCDNQKAYIGSSNFHKYSLNNSLELGVFISDDSVNIIRKLLDAIISISIIQ